MARTGPAEMTEAHKEALAKGRAESRAVRSYLEALDAHRPKRGRKRTPESVTARLEKISAEVDTAGPLDRLQLIQERIDLKEELHSMQNRINPADFEAEFVGSAQAYGERKGITYAAWRELGVDAAVLKRAGISRGRG